MPYIEFTEVGKICWDRAEAEAKRRFAQKFSERELAATQVDARLWARSNEFLSDDDLK